jgi:alanine dehydrogenase
MNTEKKGFLKYESSEHPMPQEKLLEPGSKYRKFTIGIPKEKNFQEGRIALVPEAAAMLVQSGHEILLERGAGNRAHFSDMEFADAGVSILDSKEEVFKSDIILKIGPPSLKEIDLIDSKKIILSAMHLTAQEKEYFSKLMQKRITAVSFEHIQDHNGVFPIMHSISEIVGNASILIAASYLSDEDFGKASLLGGFSGITPSEVVILGAGTVGEFAARTASGMGAIVKVFDNDVDKLRNLSNHLGHPVFTSIIQPKVLEKALKTADVVIGALQNIEGKQSYHISEDMVKEMKEGSVIVDVSIDQGGCSETSICTNHKNPIYKKHGVTHYCVPNISSRYARTASYALSNYFAPKLITIGEHGGFNRFIQNDPAFLRGIYIWQGILTNTKVANKFNIPCQDINLLLAAF